MSFLVATAAAQEERPQITPGERKPAKKKETGPRALGVLQLTDKGKATILPIFILIDGKFYDATDYKADPVPMALEAGTIYEGTRTGNSLGLFTVGSALHSKAANAPTPWIGTGLWVPAGTEVAKTTHKAETVPVGIETNDGPPRLTRGSSSTPKDARASAPPPGAGSSPSNGTPSTSGAPTPTTTSSSAPSSATPSTPPSNDKPAGSTAGSGSAPPSQNAPPSSDSSKPRESKPDNSKPSTPSNDSGADESHRPRLRRGIPTEPLPEDEVPGYGKPGSAAEAASNKPGSAKITEAAAAKAAIQLVPAVSDANGAQLHSYTFDWLKDEESDRRKQMMDLAKEQLRAYIDARAKGKITPKPAAPNAARHAPAKKQAPPEPIFDATQMVTYDLWRTNQPILVFNTDAQMPFDASAPASADSDLHYSITLVTRTDIYGNLHILYSGITDRYHLDITPRLELVDAVDADGDGRGELLFRETSDTGSGWIIYRASADKLWKMFDSLSPQ